jgi:lipoprotein NlpD
MVKEGDRVKKGTHIADMGKNGSGNTVLHFEIRRNGIPVDPLPLLPRRS